MITTPKLVSWLNSMLESTEKASLFIHAICELLLVLDIHISVSLQLVQLVS